MGKKSKFFRVCVEGATCDGREVLRQHIEQMARNYDGSFYLASANLEHFKSVYPDSVFRNYGKVLAAKSEEIKEGKLAGKLGLLVQVEASDELIALNEAGQKLRCSIEYVPNFADTGEAYLVGLAFTDNPASLGGEMMKFCASANENPLAARKINPESIITMACEVSLDFETEQTQKPSLLTRVKDMLSKSSKQQSDVNDDTFKAVELLTTHQQDLEARLTAIEARKVESVDKQALEKLTADFNELKDQLSSEERNSQRPPATGGSAAIVTDC